MGVVEAPQWLQSAWRRSLRAIGATADDATIDEVGARLIERWKSQPRVHHTLKRLIEVLARVDELAQETHDPDLVRLAAWYHGAVFSTERTMVYTRKGGVDAAGSAELAREDLAELGVPEPTIQRIAGLIEMLGRHQPPEGDIDAMALCDADLGGLASEPQRYEAYRRGVREEYSHVPTVDYLTARVHIIGKLLARPRLFTSPMGRAWEDRARDNLTAELARLKAELNTLPPEDIAAAKEALAGMLPATSAPAAPAAPTHWAAAARFPGAPERVREGLPRMRALPSAVSPSAPRTPVEGTPVVTGDPAEGPALLAPPPSPESPARPVAAPDREARLAARAEREERRRREQEEAARLDELIRQTRGEPGTDGCTMFRPPAR